MTSLPALSVAMTRMRLSPLPSSHRPAQLTAEPCRSTLENEQLISSEVSERGPTSTTPPAGKRQAA
ncbi:MAG: hypothetical protein K2X57_03420 [Xanthobacteraceae bacterium]|nr:hypothetical protein [Xanthobacteraceae bacterium]MBY0611242.1 hypothetical protein [Beijerinckiaceae bacterium]